MVFGDLGVILAVTDMAPQIPTPIGVALRGSHASIETFEELVAYRDMAVSPLYKKN